MADDDAAHRGRDDDVDRLAQLARHLRGERGGEPPGAPGIHQDARALQIIFAVAARGEKEMALEQGVGGTEFGQDFIVGHGELFFCPVRRTWRASGFKRRRFASRKLVLAMLEASGKRVYSSSKERRVGTVGVSRG